MIESGFTKLVTDPENEDIVEVEVPVYLIVTEVDEANVQV